jgi:3-hydroxyisobutyrate dehydrogenase
MAFVGLGTMGKPMAANLVRAGYPLATFDLNRKPVDELALLGARPARSAAEAAAQADVAITMVPSSPDVEAAVLGPSGLLEGLQAGTTLIEMSTIDPRVTRRIGEVAARRGIKMLDAPVSGSFPRALDGTLTIMVGGTEEVFNACLPIFRVLGESIFHVGPLGMGETVKLCNNLMAAIHQIAISEAFAIGMAAGAEPRVLHQVITSSSGNCSGLHTRPPCPGLVDSAPADGDWAPGFKVDLMLKDVGLMLDLAQSVGAETKLGALAKELYGVASRAGLGQKDYSAVDLVIRGAPKERFSA